MRKELKKVMEKYIIMKKVNKFKLLAAGLLIGVAFWLAFPVVEAEALTAVFAIILYQR